MARTMDTRLSSMHRFPRRALPTRFWAPHAAFRVLWSRFFTGEAYLPIPKIPGQRDFLLVNISPVEFARRALRRLSVIFPNTLLFPVPKDRPFRRKHPEPPACRVGRGGGALYAIRYTAS